MNKLGIIAFVLVLVAALAIPAIMPTGAAACTSGNCPTPSPGGNTITLTGTIRDFCLLHSDFGKVPAGGFHLQTGLVNNTLDANGKPVFSGNNGLEGNIQSQDTFSQWYRDVPGVNLTQAYQLTLTETSPGSGIYTFRPGTDGAFFPADVFPPNQLNSSDPWLIADDQQWHNFLFTIELHGKITYKAGTNQTLSFNSDDDLWVFVNGKLMVDFGGVHARQSSDTSVNLDTEAVALGLNDGQTYNLDMFFAERHTTASQLVVCGPVAPVPEASTIVLLSLGVVALSGFVWYGTRRRKVAA